VEDTVMRGNPPSDGLVQVEQAVAARYGVLSRGQRRVIDLLLTDTRRGAVLSAADLAAEASVSESTVTRAAQALGFAGFPDLQARLRASFASSRIERLRASAAVLGNTPEEAALQVMLEDADEIRTTVSQLDLATIRAALDAIIGARRTHVFGSRGSHGLAHMLVLGLRMVLPETRLLRQEAGDLVDRLTRIEAGDTVIAIGFHRVHRDTVHVVREARRAGALTIAITDRRSGPIGREADLALIARIGPPRLVSSHTVGASLVNGLLTAAGLQLQDRAAEHLQALEKLMDQLGTHAEDVPS
jgi:DNA-binding MurR/RpiR family transcriptional regulator